MCGLRVIETHPPPGCMPPTCYIFPVTDKVRQALALGLGVKQTPILFPTLCSVLAINDGWLTGRLKIPPTLRVLPTIYSGRVADDLKCLIWLIVLGGKEVWG